MKRAIISTQAGDFLAEYSETGLAQLHFPGQWKDREGEAAPAKWVKQTQRALEACIAGKEARELPPLDVAGTEFRKQVWDLLLAIPAGKTRSYGDLAKDLGKAGASRAVGSACGANPIPVLIPCHRVLASSGKLGGFSGGLDWKRRLLKAEGVLLTA